MFIWICRYVTIMKTNLRYTCVISLHYSLHKMTTSCDTISLYDYNWYSFVNDGMLSRMMAQRLDPSQVLFWNIKITWTSQRQIYNVILSLTIMSDHTHDWWSPYSTPNMLQLNLLGSLLIVWSNSISDHASLLSDKHAYLTWQCAMTILVNWCW